MGAEIERRNTLRARTALDAVRGISRRDARRSMRWLLRESWVRGSGGGLARSGQILELLWR